MKKTYFNLSCGVEGLDKWITKVKATGSDNIKDMQYGYIRVQSTALEQKRWSFVINDLDNDFLFNLAIGVDVEVVDFSSQKAVPRSLYQGIPWIQYVLNRFWFDINSHYVIVKGHNVSAQFDAQYRKYEEDFKMKLKYYRKYINPEAQGIRLTAAQVQEYAITENGQAAYDGREDQAAIYKSIALT